MSQTPAIFFKPALRPVVPPAEKAPKKQAGNGQAPFANLLGEGTAAERGIIPNVTDSYGASDAVPGMGARFAARLSGRKGEAAKAAGDKRASEVSSPSDVKEATGSQPSNWEYASQSAVNVPLAFPPGGTSAGSHSVVSVKQGPPASENAKASGTAAETKTGNNQVLTPGGTLISSASSFAQEAGPAAPLNASGTVEMPLAIELAQQALAPADNLDAINQRKPQTSKPATSIAAGSVTVLGLQTHLAPEASPGFKLSQAMERTKTESTGEGTTGAPAPVSNVGEPVAAAKDAGFHRDSPSGENSPPVQAASSAGPNMALAAQAGAQPPASPVQQIFNAIEEAAPAGAPAQNATQADQLALDGHGPVKSLTIALDPQGLGTVSIELSIKNSQLGVRVEASDASTAQLLKQSGSTLTKLLESGGYAVASLSVHVSPQPPPASTPAQTGPNGQSAFSMSNSGGGGSGGTGAQEGEANKHHDRKGSGNGRSEGGNRDRSLYV